MKTPTTPPSLSKLLKGIGPDNLLQLLAKVAEPTVSGEYLHWDKLRHRTPPFDLSLREWWLGLKLQRGTQAKPIALSDNCGTPFSFNLADPIPEKLHEIDLKAGGAVQMPEPVVNPESRNSYIVRSLMEEAITSSQLEGAATTREVAKEMIRRGITPRDRSEQMILNNFQTMERIIQVKNEPLTEDLIFEIHRMVTDKTLDNNSAAGRLRRDDENCVVGDDFGEIDHVPPNPIELPARMAAMIDFANGKTPSYFVHPAIRSIILHFWLAYDHPFIDGNGRTARALFYWSMLRHHYWLFEFVSISRIFLRAPVKYGRAFLYTETDDNDLTYFLIYHLQAIDESIRDLYNYINLKTNQTKALGQELSGMVLLNHRQRDLISHALRHPGFLYSIKSHQNSHSVVYQTARNDLLDLVSRGLLTKEVRGKSFSFKPAKDIAEKLREPGP
ncbi:Fic family protein [Singulisphaera sp. Ch08]|uniref:Fic family protein n=1 Tax=Singulisphaera sp. Ch08 TaxID=3120278 RepID=A0AAU7CKT6_9BACT